MKTAAIFLYGIAALISLAADGLNGLMYMFPLFATVITVFFGLIVGILGLFKAYGAVKQAHVERETHKKWIL